MKRNINFKTERNKRIFEMRIDEGKSYNEIARQLMVEFPREIPISVQRVSEIYHLYEDEFNTYEKT